MNNYNGLAQYLNVVKRSIFEENFIELANEGFDKILDSYSLDQFLAYSFDFLKGSSASSIILAIRDIRLHLSYEDILHAFERLKNSELGMYYYTRFLIEELHIDPIRIMDQNVHLREPWEYVQKGLSVSSMQLSNTPYEEEDEEEKEMRLLIERLKSQGAPMIN